MRSPPPSRRGGGDRRHPRQTHRWGSQPTDDRGQSTALDYTLGLSVAALVLTGLTIAAADFVTGQREQVVRTELGVVGEQLVGEIVAADRLVQAGNQTSQLVVNASLPRRVVGTGYSVSVVNGSPDQQLRLTTVDPEVSVTVAFTTESPVVTDSVDGGTITIRYDSDADQLEVAS